MKLMLNLILEFGDILTNLKIDLSGQMKVNDELMVVKRLKLLKEKFLKK
jgi:hypothetical protein